MPIPSVSNAKLQVHTQVPQQRGLLRLFRQQHPIATTPATLLVFPARMLLGSLGASSSLAHAKHHTKRNGTNDSEERFEHNVPYPTRKPVDQSRSWSLYRCSHRPRPVDWRMHGRRMRTWSIPLGRLECELQCEVVSKG
jgi:hypothetical protein